jgi:hypothetical protein
MTHAAMLERLSRTFLKEIREAVSDRGVVFVVGVSGRSGGAPANHRR